MTDDRIRTLVQAETAPAAPPFETLLKPSRLRLRRARVAAALVCVCALVGTGWFVEMQVISAPTHAIVEAPTTDWLLEAPDAGFTPAPENGDQG